MLRTTSAWDADNPSLPDLSPPAAGQHPWHGELSMGVRKGSCSSMGLCPGSCASLPGSNLNFGQNQAPVPLRIISLAPVEHRASLPAGSHRCSAASRAGGHLCSHTTNRIARFGMLPSAATHCQRETMSLSSPGSTEMFPGAEHPSLQPPPTPWKHF